jgi:hypothetical protein
MALLKRLSNCASVAVMVLFDLTYFFKADRLEEVSGGQEMRASMGTYLLPLRSFKVTIASLIMAVDASA